MGEEEKETRVKEILSNSTVVLEDTEEVKEMQSLLKGMEIDIDLLEVFLDFPEDLPFNFYFFEGSLDGEFIPIGNPYISFSEFKEELLEEGVLWIKKKH